MNARGFLGKVGGGSVANCITEEYAANFLLENRMKDMRIQEMKTKAAQFNFRGTTNAQEARLKNTKQKLIVLDDKHNLNTCFSPIRAHVPG